MTTVVVQVVLPHDPSGLGELPPDVAALVRALPGVRPDGWAQRAGGPWRARLLVRGPECVATARALEDRLRALGHDAETCFFR